MALLIQVTALDDCVYRGQFYPIGEVFSLPAIEAAVLRDKGKIALASDEIKTAAARAVRAGTLPELTYTGLVVSDVPEPQPRRRRRRLPVEDA